jgi:pimeloyl-ACP methyl ester carboxylesterase
VDYALNPLDGSRIAYRTLGTGPAIVLIHGTALSQVIWRGFGYLAQLSAHYTVITLDLRGHGRSDKPHQESAYQMPFFVADVLAVLDELELAQVHCLGYSLGGRVGFSLADTQPDRVLSLISVAGAAGTEAGAFDRVFFPGCITTLDTGGMSGFLQSWQEHSQAPLDSPTKAAFRANDAHALAAYMRTSDADPGVVDSRLAQLRQPILMLVGSADDERLREARRIKTILPCAQLQVIEGATHGDVLRRPETQSAIGDFLADQERSRAENPRRARR